MRPCPLCGNKEFLNYVYKTYVTCINCQHTYQPRPPKKVWMNPGTGDCNGYEGAEMNTEERAVNMFLASWLTSRVAPKKTLDIGCGYPYLAYCFEYFGADSIAIDGAFAEGIINNDLGVKTEACDWEVYTAEDYAKWKGLDLITMIHCFEHFKDPIAAMKRAMANLNDEGVLYIRSPSKDVAGIERDHTEGHINIHPNIFGTESMKYAAAEAGLHLIWFEHSIGFGQTSWIFKKRPAKISLCMIVKNEEKRIKRCLDSVRPYCDEMLIVDTGSTDNTIKVAEEAGATVFKSEHFDENTKSGEFHFAKARNESISKASGDWIFWMDADDIFKGPSELKLDPELDVYDVVIEYGDLRFNHARLFRNGWGVHFKGAIHEFCVIDGLRMDVMPDVSVEHETGDKPGRVDRNIAILESELVSEPDNMRTMFYLANALREAGRITEAINIYNMYIESGGNFPDELYLAQYYLAMCFYQVDNHDLAIKEALKAVALNDSWAEAYCCIGENYWHKKDYTKAINYLEIALSLDYPSTNMFVRQELYDLVPRWWLARCYETIGDLDKAKEYVNDEEEGLEEFESKQYVIEVCRPGALGDVLCTTPAVRELREKHPDAHIRYVVHPSSKVMLEHNPDIDEIFETDKYQSDKHADTRIMFNYPMHLGYPDVPMTKHLAHHFADCANVKLPDNWKNILNLAPDCRVKLEHTKPVIVFHVRTGWSRYKEWPLERWEELIRLFPEYQFIQLGAKGEKAIEGAQNMCGRLTLRESFSVLSQAVLLIGLDSVLQHAAQALGVPAVVLFGSTSPAGSGYAEHTNLWGGCTESPCYKEDNTIAVHKKPPCPYEHKCMIDYMSVEKVAEAVRVITSASLVLF